jgi:voltage-gated potassium channel
MAAARYTKGTMPRAQTKIRHILEDEKHPLFAITNDLLALVTIVSIASIALETVPAFSAYHSIFIAIEWGSAGIFTLEYLMRLWIAKRKTSYIFSFFGIIDLIAILPTFLHLGNFTFLKAARGVRIIRFLRMLRLLKLARTPKKAGTSSLWVFNLQIYAIAVLIAVVAIGTAFFIAEPGIAPHIPSGMYWAFVLLVGGIPHEPPTTATGTAVMVFARFSSMIFFGMLIGLVGTIMRKTLTGSEKD